MIDKSDYNIYKEKMEKSIKVLFDQLSGLRAGRANPAILNKITVDYYGVTTPISQVGSVSMPEARIIVFQPWDVSILKEVEKAIQKSDIGINPNNDGKTIRLVFPQLTEERRKDLTKTVKKHGEDTKVAVRSIRRDAIEQFKAKKKSNELSEDELKEAEKDLQNITDKFILEVDKIVQAKEKEVLEV